MPWRLKRLAIGKLAPEKDVAFLGRFELVLFCSHCLTVGAEADLSLKRGVRVLIEPYLELMNEHDDVGRFPLGISTGADLHQTAEDDRGWIEDQVEGELITRLALLANEYQEQWPAIGPEQLGPFVIYLCPDGTWRVSDHDTRRLFLPHVSLEQVIVRLKTFIERSELMTAYFTCPFRRTDEGCYQLISVCVDRRVKLPYIKFRLLVPDGDYLAFGRSQEIPEAMIELMLEPSWIEASRG